MDGIPFGFDGDMGPEAIPPGEIDRAANRLLETYLNATEAEDAAHFGRIHLDHDVHVAVGAVVPPSHRPEHGGVHHAEIVNLRQTRKRKLRADKDRQAADNRVKFGRTKGEKKRAEAETERDSRRLDQARLVPDE
jgi:hypothetical protein